ncbi:MAG: hypothetical protein L0Y56_02155 [Nitrospira sp.]|nr:hypothetical protein [Nitrospira sp.]
MRLLSVILIFVILSLITSGLALAHTEDTCPHDMATVQSLRECVQHASDHGAINNPGITHNLLAKLDAAQAAVERNQSSVAVNILEAMARAVEAQAGQHIAPEHAKHLLEHTQLVIQALGG